MISGQKLWLIPALLVYCIIYFTMTRTSGFASTPQSMALVEAPAELGYVVPPFKLFERRFRLSKKNKINVCVIEKNMSTILTAIMCYLTNPKAFVKHNRNINTEVHRTRFCRRRNEDTSFMSSEKHGLLSRAEMSRWLHLAVSRDPIERFVSGFADKCLIEQIYKTRHTTCQKCQGNVTCFVESEFDRMRRFAKGQRMNRFDDKHFFPQNWRCEYNKYFSWYKIIRYGNKADETQRFFDELFSYFRMQRVTEQEINFIKEQVESGRTNHSTVHSDIRKELDRRVRSDPHLMKLLVKMYYHDFLIFGYPLPSI